MHSQWLWDRAVAALGESRAWGWIGGGGAKPGSAEPDLGCLLSGSGGARRVEAASFKTKRKTEQVP